MFIEEVLKELSKGIHELHGKVEKVTEILNDHMSEDEPEFLTVRQLSEMKDWPYSEQATRKMIIRNRLDEGVHYFKVDGKIICKWSACRRYLSKNYADIRIA